MVFCFNYLVCSFSRIATSYSINRNEWQVVTRVFFVEDVDLAGEEHLGDLVVEHFLDLEASQSLHQELHVVACK